MLGLSVCGHWAVNFSEEYMCLHVFLCVHTGLEGGWVSLQGRKTKTGRLETGGGYDYV